MRSFFHKTIPSLLRLSNADVDQPPQPPPRHRRSFPHQSSDVAGLRLIGSSVDIHHSPNVLEAVTVKYSGNSETPSDGGGGGGSGRTCELALCTESLGLESSSDRTRIDETDEGAESPAAADTTGDEAARPRRREAGPAGGSGGAVSKSFPPILSTLRRSGRPRFDLRSVRRDGRLEIIRVRNDRPEIIRSRRSDGCLVMHLDEDGPQQGDHCHDHDDQDDL